MRTILLSAVFLLLFVPAGLAQGASLVLPPENSPVDWFLDICPIPSLSGTGIRKLRFYEQVPESAPSAAISASRRLFVLRRPGPPVVEMEFDSLGRLVHAVHNRWPRGYRDTVEVHWRLSYNEKGQLAFRAKQRINLELLQTISRDTTFYTWDQKGRMASLRIPHRPWLDWNDTVLVATNKLTEYGYNRKGQLTRLLKRCDPSDGRPSGMLVICARDSFLYDADGRLAEIMSYNIREWQTVRHFLYDSRGWLKETAVYAGLNPAFYLRWRYDGNGKLLECVQESADGFDPPRTTTFGYDSEGVLNRYQVRKGADLVELDWVVEQE